MLCRRMVSDVAFLGMIMAAHEVSDRPTHPRTELAECSEILAPKLASSRIPVWHLLARGRVCPRPGEVREASGVVPVPALLQLGVKVSEWKPRMRDEQSVWKKQRVGRLVEEANGELASSLDPLMRDVGIQKIGKVSWRDARGEAATVVRKRFVMVAGDNAGPARGGQDEVEHPYEELQSKAIVIEQVAEQDDVRRRCHRVVRPFSNQRERRLKRQNIAVQVSNDP